MEPLSGESGNEAASDQPDFRADASMEPLSGESGNDALRRADGKAHTRFNGAALRRERKPRGKR